MMSIEKLDLKFKEFFAEKNYQKAQFLSNEILNSIDEEKYPVYISLKNGETPYVKLFDNYFEGFYAEKNPNSDALKWVHNSLVS